MPAKNILVIKHGAFGDFIQALGVMRGIRITHRDAHITLLTTRPFVALAEASNYFNSVVVDTRPRWYELLKLAVLRKFLNQGKFARVYDLQNSERSGLYLGMFRRVPEWNGIAWSASHRMPDDAARKSMHVFDALRAQVGLAGVHRVTIDNLTWIKSDVTPFRLPQPYVLVAAGSSAAHTEKRWPVARYAALCRWMAEGGFTPVLLGTQDEAAVNDAIMQDCPQAVNLTGLTSLMQIPGLAREAAAAIGNDTGPIQMIGPTGCRTLGLFPGFSNPARHGPLGVQVRTLQGQTMEDISLEDVKAAMDMVLTNGRPIPALLLPPPSAEEPQAEAM